MHTLIRSRDPAGTPGPSGAMQRRTALLIGAIVVAGMVFVAGLWAGTFILIGSEQRTALAHARTEVSNLSAAFQDEVTRALDHVSGAMELVAQRMRADNGAFDIHAWASQIPLLVSPAIQAAIIGPDGHLRSTTFEAHPNPIDLSDREHFRVHLDGTYHGLFISKPIVGRLTGQVGFQVTSRVDSADGRFLGVIVFSLSPSQITALHKSINLGPRGMMALFGTDNIVRARFGADSPDGTKGVGAKLLPFPARATAGPSQSLVHIAVSPVDRVTRIFSVASSRRLSASNLSRHISSSLGRCRAASRCRGSWA